MASTHHAIEAEVSLSPEELRTLQAQYTAELPNPSPSSKFNFGWGLVRSRSGEDQQAGVRILYQLYKDEGELRRECLYYLALGSMKLGEYGAARKYIDELLATEPTNLQAQSLRQIIDDRVRTEGLIGLGIVGGAAALGVVVLGALIRGARK